MGDTILIFDSLVQRSGFHIEKLPRHLPITSSSNSTYLTLKFTIRKGDFALAVALCELRRLLLWPHFSELKLRTRPQGLIRTTGR